MIAQRTITQFFDRRDGDGYRMLQTEMMVVVDLTMSSGGYENKAAVDLN